MKLLIIVKIFCNFQKNKITNEKKNGINAMIKSKNKINKQIVVFLEKFIRKVLDQIKVNFISKDFLSLIKDNLHFLLRRITFRVFQVKRTEQNKTNPKTPREIRRNVSETITSKSEKKRGSI